MPLDASLHVLDTTVLSDFAHVGRADLIQLILAGQGVTTEVVRAELHLGEQLGLVPPYDWNWLSIVELSSKEMQLFEELAATIGRGEASCLAVAISRNAVIVTDDFIARRKARRLGVEVTGTLGILRMLKVEQHMPTAEVNELLAQMIANGYYSPIEDISEILDLEE